MDNNKEKENEIVDFEGSGVGSRSNIEKLAKDYVNTSYSDFTKGAEYADLSKRYGDMGKQAMKDTMAQASARTGGYANSYAISAGQQAQNSFMSKLEDAARGLYDSQRAEKADKLGVAQELYDRDYAYHKEAEADAKSDLESYQNELYTDFSLMSAEELDEIINGKAKDGEIDLSGYIKNGMDEAGVLRLAKMAKAEIDKNTAAAEKETAKENEESLKKDMATWDQFNRDDPRIPEGEQDIYYNAWKAGWKDNALDMDTVNAAIDEGNLSPNVLRSYEIIYGISLCAENLDNLAEAMATGGAYNFTPQVEKYVDAWINYDEEGFCRYLNLLDQTDSNNPILKYIGIKHQGVSDAN